MRRSAVLVCAAAAVYAAVLAGSWLLGRDWTRRNSVALLRKGREMFVERLEELLGAVQWCQSSLAFDALGGHTGARAVPDAEIQDIARRFYIDELNVVSSNGLVIASNLPKVKGHDFHSDPRCAAFLTLLDPTGSVYRLCQSFRYGVINPEDYCRYFGEVFDDRSGLLQLGYSMERLSRIFAYSNVRAFENWEFSRCGHFDAVDTDRNGVPDLAATWKGPVLGETGFVEESSENGERGWRLTFPFAGRLFCCWLPAREFGEQATRAFLAFAFTSGILIFLFAMVLARLAFSNQRVTALRRAADARNAADLELARKIQMSSLPDARRLSSAAIAFTLSAVTHPAREVGGDFYDFFVASDGRLAFLVADVSGKGVPAALFMNESMHAFREALQAKGDLVAAVTAMNAALCANNAAEMFVTGWFGLLDERGALEYVNAGHNRPYLLGADGAVTRLAERGGRFLGMFPDATYRATRRTLAHGERLVLFTDGVTEAMNVRKKTYGEKRLADLLATRPADVEAAVLADVAAHVAGAEASDDLTLLVLGWYGPLTVTERIFDVSSETCGACVAFLQETIPLADRKKKARLINAADELVANVVSYSGAKKLNVSVAGIPGRCRVMLTDDGVAYNPLAHRDPDTTLALEDRPEGGLGILVAKRLVDRVSWKRDCHRNRVSLIQSDAVS